MPALSWQIRSGCECLWTQGAGSFRRARRSCPPRSGYRQFQTPRTIARKLVLCCLRNWGRYSSARSSLSSPCQEHFFPNSGLCSYRLSTVFVLILPPESFVENRVPLFSALKEFERSRRNIRRGEQRLPKRFPVESVPSPCGHVI